MADRMMEFLRRLRGALAACSSSIGAGLHGASGGRGGQGAFPALLCRSVRRLRLAHRRGGHCAQDRAHFGLGTRAGRNPYVVGRSVADWIAPTVTDAMGGVMGGAPWTFLTTSA